MNKNLKDIPHCTALNLAISDKKETLNFYEFPNKHSEYNSMTIEQYQEEEWFKKVKFNTLSIEAINLKELLNTYKTAPSIIKIDVEGGEYKVIKGMDLENTKDLFKNTYIVMEYLNEERNNHAHQEAYHLLLTHGFKAYIINNEGTLVSVKDIEDYLTEKQLDSDNIVFTHR